MKAKDSGDKDPADKGNSSATDWDFKVEEKTLMDVINKDRKADEKEKHQKITKQEKKLRLDYAAIDRLKVSREKEIIAHKKNAEVKKSFEEDIQAAPVEKRIKSLLIDVLFFIVLIIVSNVIAKSSSNVIDIERVCNITCLKNISVQVKGKISNPVLEKKIWGNLTQIYYDPKSVQKFSIEVTSKSILLGLYFIFFIIPQALFGVSFGKFIAKLKIEHADGGPLSWSQGFFRESLGKLISLITVVGPFLFLVNRRRKSLHDFLANSIVVEIYTGKK